MFTHKMLRFVADLAGVRVQFFPNGGAHLTGPLVQLQTVRAAAIRAGLLGDMRLIVQETIDGRAGGAAPRIEIHPSLIVAPRVRRPGGRAVRA